MNSRKAFLNDLDLNQYDAFYRTLDPQIGRWSQVDPKTESMEMWSPYASMYNNPIRHSDLLGDSSIAPRNGLVERVPYKDGDQTGIITNATEEHWQQSPVGAAIKDASFLGLELLGWNAIDNFITNRFNPENNTAEKIITEAVVVGIATTKGEGGAAPKTKLGGKITEPLLPSKTIAKEGNIEAVHYTKSGDHGPPHLHIQGGGKETKVGQNGKPIDGSPKLTAEQQAFVNNFKGDIRKAIKQIGKWFDYNRK